MGKKRAGQMQISFGMIFSIIIIIAVMAVAFYTIRYFLGFKSCTDVGLFYNDLQEIVDDAYRASAGYYDTFTGSLPKDVKKVCIGNMSSNSGEFRNEYNSLERIRHKGNLFLYPLNSGCEDLTFYKLDNIEKTEFFCVDVLNGKVNIDIRKESFGPVILEK